MSLKTFHLVFVILSVVLAAFVAAWAVGQYQLEHEVQYLATSIAALAASASLVAYAAMFRRKTRHL